MKKGSINPNLFRARIGNCVVCNKEYRAVKDFKGRKQKYCNIDCWKIRAQKVCKKCGIKFGGDSKKRHHGTKYCSRKCSVSDMRGDKSPRWKDGKSLNRERARQSAPLSKWRLLVRKRDGNKCVKCGDVNYLHVHHIKGFSEYPELATDIENGITLCEMCHSLIHKRWVGAKMRIKRWQEFTGKEATHAETGERFNSGVRIPPARKAPAKRVAAGE